MLEECGLPYRVVPVNIAKNEQFAPDFLAISPNNQDPGHRRSGRSRGQPITVFESGAILQYLGRKTGQFYPTDERQRVAVTSGCSGRWRASGRCSARPITLRSTPRKGCPTAIDRFTAEAKRLYGVLERRLEGRDFIADELLHRRHRNGDLGEAETSNRASISPPCPMSPAGSNGAREARRPSGASQRLTH